MCGLTCAAQRATALPSCPLPQGASAAALAQALSAASGGTISPELLSGGDANAVAAAVESAVQGKSLGGR